MNPVSTGGAKVMESSMVSAAPLAPHAPVQASTDAQLVALWLHGRPATTQRAYAREVRTFLAAVGKPLAAVTLGDLQAFADGRGHLAPATRARTLHAVKSLLAFGQRIGYLPFNVGAPLRIPGSRNTLAERILPETDVHRLIALEPGVRNHALLRLFYAAGVRVAELCGLRWRDTQPRDDGGQITVWGKGQRTRAVVLPAGAWRELAALRGDAGGDDPVFRSRKRGALSTAQAWRIVRAAAQRAGVELPVSPHWLRHAHASHALDRGEPIHLVQATLGHASVATTGKYLHARPTESSGKYLAV
jgi:integrase/recombinase XerD